MITKTKKQIREAIAGYENMLKEIDDSYFANLKDGNFDEAMRDVNNKKNVQLEILDLKKRLKGARNETV